VILLAEETRRGCAITEEAASGQVEFSAQDLAWTKEAELRERHLSQFAQHAPIGKHESFFLAITLLQPNSF